MEGLDWVWGRHPVLESLLSGRARQVLIAAGRSPAPILEDIARVAAEQCVPIRQVDAVEIQRIARGHNSQGVAAQVSQARLRDVRDLLSVQGERGTNPFLLVLDQLQDPHNVGSLLRSAEAAGVTGVVLTRRRAAPLGGVVSKVSAGAVNHLAIAEVGNLSQAVVELKEGGIWVVGLEGGARESLYSVDLTVPVAILVGSEGSGMRRLTRELCDFVVSLPMAGHIESLNAAVAGAIALFEVVRQRQVAARGESS